MKTAVLYEILDIELVGTGLYFTEVCDAKDFIASDRYKPYCHMIPRNPEYYVKKHVMKIFDNLPDFDAIIKAINRTKMIESINKKLSKEELEFIGMKRLWY